MKVQRSIVAVLSYPPTPAPFCAEFIQKSQSVSKSSAPKAPTQPKVPPRLYSNRQSWMLAFAKKKSSAESPSLPVIVKPLNVPVLFEPN